MKFKIIRSKFFEGLKQVQNIVAGKGSLPILQNVLIEAVGKELTLTTTDLDISIKCQVECETVEAGATTLPVKLLFNSIIKAPEGEVTVEIDAREQATIKAANTRYRINGKSKDEFPKMEEDEDATEYSLTLSVLKEMLRKTHYAASQDDSRRTLRGLLMSFKNEKLTMVATDGRRLAIVEKEMEFPKSYEKDIVLPFKAVQELLRMNVEDGNVKVIASKSRICFVMEGLKIFSKLMEDVYPNYQQVIPTNCSEEIMIDRQLLLDALERTNVMTVNEAQSTRLVFEMNRLQVNSAASEIGDARDELAVKYAGEKLEITFNPNYLMDPLRAIDDDEIKLCLKDGQSPAIIRCSIPFLYVIMPLRSN